jgi:type I restriction enzyme S subunit
MSSDARIDRVRDLLSSGVLWVEDGNHGENRPLSDEFAREGTPFVRPDDLAYGVVDFGHCDRINAKALNRIRKGKGRAGDIAFTHRATVGRIARVGPSAPDFVANPGVTLWRILDRDTLDPNYLYYFMQTPFFMNQVWAEAGNTDTFPYISLTQQRGLAIRYPRLAVQRAIGSALSALDDRIALLRETNATLEAIAQAVFKSWFVDFDPVRAKQQGLAPAGMDEATAALFPDSFEESALGLVPKGWSVQLVGDAVECVGGATPDTKDPSYWSPEEHAWTTPKDLSGLPAPVLLSTERRLSTKGVAKIGSGLLPVGTLLMSSRAPIGYLAIAQVPVAINQGYIAMPPGSLLPPLYMLFWCRQNMERIKARANGSTFMEISKKAFRPIPALVPASPAIEAFLAVASPLFARLVSNEQQAQTLATMRDTLLPRMISGQLRLPEAESLLTDVLA